MVILRFLVLPRDSVLQDLKIRRWILYDEVQSNTPYTVTDEVPNHSLVLTGKRYAEIIHKCTELNTLCM